MGSEAADALTIGVQNVALGNQALSTDDVGSRNTDELGDNNFKSSKFTRTTTSNNMYNVGVGFGGTSITSGYHNTFVGSIDEMELTMVLLMGSLVMKLLGVNCGDENVDLLVDLLEIKL